MKMKRFVGFLVGGLALALTVALFGTALAQVQPPYFDTVGQWTTPAGIEHNQFWKEYSYSMTPTPASGILVYATPALASAASTAVADLNSSRPPAVRPMSVVGYYEGSDVKINWANCPADQYALGCVLIDEWSNMSTHNVYTWKRATAYIRPNLLGSSWTSQSLAAVIGHELLHLHGLNDQYGSGGTCNSSVISQMDKFYNSYGNLVPCDYYFPASFDIYNWAEYKNTSRYDRNNEYVWGDGAVISYWQDYAWSDYWIRTAYQKWNGSAWVNIVIANGTATNGSHREVPGATGWLVGQGFNLAWYGVQNQIVRVCAVPIYNYVQVGAFYTCSPEFWYGVY